MKPSRRTDYTIDPEGSISIVDVSRGAAAVTQADVRTAGFSSFTRASLGPQVRIYGPRATPAQDIEPEYIAVSPDSKTAWVTLQENNAMAIVDIDAARVTRVVPLGVKDHWKERNSIDASDRDLAISLRTWTVFGLYLPDGIATYAAPDGKIYLLTANEGDSRAWTGYNEERRVSELQLDPRLYPNQAELKLDYEMGRLRVTGANGDEDGDGDYDFLYTFGARSFSVWNSEGRQVYDSGNDFEVLSRLQMAASFNISNSDNVLDGRSDDKGPEPEAVVVGTVRGKPYAFIANERQGNIAIYEMTNPENPRYAGQYWNRNPGAATNTAAAGDLGPEGLAFIAAADSPTGKPLLAVANEISGTTTVWQID